jgi:hypothetical protein
MKASKLALAQLSFDVIYGHNINGKGANWFTVATTIRFPPMK